MKNIKLNKLIPLRARGIKSKKGLSGVVTVMLLILLTFILVSGVWVMINTFVKKQVGDSEACFGVFDQVQIGNYNTCLDEVNNFLQISIEVGDIELEKLLVSVAGEENSENFYLINETIEDFLADYPFVLGSSDFGEEVSIPEKDSGKTYVVNLTEFGVGEPKKIEIAPIMDGVQCGVSDIFENIESCALLVGE